jgi:membrane protein DedA with SNARE-associated domain
MVGEITDWILGTLRYHGGWSVFLGVLIEQIIIPIPSPVIIMGAGLILIPAQAAWAAAMTKISLEIVLPGSAASLLGAWGMYYVGLWGGKIFVDRFQRFLGFNWMDVQALGSRMSVHGVALSLFFLRALPIVPLSLVSLVGGVLKVRTSVFLIWSFLGSIPRCFFLAVLGWQLGHGALEWARGVNRFETFVSLGLVAVGAGVVLYLRKKVGKAITAEEKRMGS